MFLTDRHSGYVFDMYLTNREAETLVEGFEIFLGTLENQHQIRVEVLECNNEITRSNRIMEYLRGQKHIRCEPSGAERSGGVIKAKARAMRNGAKLPSFLWVEIYKAAVYLHNRTPRYSNHWQTPYECFYTYLAFRDGLVVKDRKPSQTHLKAYGCKVFAMTTERQLNKNKRQKLNPNAWIGYLVGYKSTNIY